MKATRWLMVVVLTGGAACGAQQETSPAAPDVTVALSASAPRVSGQVTQTNLVSDQAGGAAVTNADLVNAWGLAFNPMGPAWVSSNGAGLSPVFDAAGNVLRTVVIPTPPGGEPPSAPTGQGFNGDAQSFE